MVKHLRSLFLILICFYFSSCFTGKVYHHARVRVEKTDYSIGISKNPANQGYNDSLVDNYQSTIPVQLVSKINAADKQVSPKPKVSLKTKSPSDISNPTYWKYKKTNQPKLKRTYKIKDTKEESILGALGLITAIFVGGTGLLLIIAGFIMGLYGIVIGFWIAWGIGLLAILFALFLNIYFSTLGYGDLFSGLSIIGCSILFILAIVFLLIVLL